MANNRMIIRLQGHKYQQFGFNQMTETFEHKIETSNLWTRAIPPNTKRDQIRCATADPCSATSANMPRERPKREFEIMTISRVLNLQVLQVEMVMQHRHNHSKETWHVKSNPQRNSSHGKTQ